MQKNYELLYIVHPDLEGSTDKVTERVTAFIKKAGGEIASQEDWGKRKLAYKLAKNDYGVYVLVNFSVDSVKLHEVERDLRLSEEVLRSMIVAVPELKEVKVKPKKEKKEAEKVKAEEPASIIVSDEEAKPVKKTTAKAKTVATKDEPVKEKTAAKKTPAKKPAKKAEADEAERLKKLDEKLDELLK